MRFARKESRCISLTQYIPHSHQLLFQLQIPKKCNRENQHTQKKEDIYIDLHNKYSHACSEIYAAHTLSESSEPRIEERSELMRESSAATRWRSASSSRVVREISDDAVSCSSLACSTSADMPAAGDSTGEFSIGRRWPSDQSSDARF